MCTETATGPALGMFEMFGRTGPQTLGGPQLWTPKIPHKLTCQTDPLMLGLWRKHGYKCCNQMRFASIQFIKVWLQPGRDPAGAAYRPTSYSVLQTFCFKGAGPPWEGRKWGETGEGQEKGGKGKGKRGAGWREGVGRGGKLEQGRRLAKTGSGQPTEPSF